MIPIWERPTAKSLHAPAIGRAEVVDNLVFVLEHHCVFVGRAGARIAVRNDCRCNPGFESRAARTIASGFKVCAHVIRRPSACRYLLTIHTRFRHVLKDAMQRIRSTIRTLN